MQIISNLNKLQRRSLFFLRRFRAFIGKGWVVEKNPIIVDDTKDICNNPIFVIGTHRSGTSLVRRILDSHPNIACPPESYYLQHFTSILKDTKTLNALKSFGYTNDELIKGLKKNASYFHEMYKNSKNKKRWADKTPQYVYHLNTIETIYKNECKYIFVIRHPLDVAYSLYKRGWEIEGCLEKTENRVIDASRYVAESGYIQKEFMENNAEKIFILYYEDLMDDPVTVLKSMCDFIQEPWSDNMVKHHEQKHDFGTEDPVSRGTKGFSRSSGNWKAWEEEDITKAWEILEKLSQYHGYSKEDTKREGIQICH